MTQNGPKNPVLGSKTEVSENSEYTEYLELVFSVFRILHFSVSRHNHIFFFHSDSKFNQKFDYEFGTQGLTNLHHIEKTDDNNKICIKAPLRY